MFKQSLGQQGVPKYPLETRGEDKRKRRAVPALQLLLKAGCASLSRPTATKNQKPKTALPRGGFLGAEAFEAVVFGFEGFQDAVHDGVGGQGQVQLAAEGD